MEKHKIECSDLIKCGEITTQLLVGKRDFFLNCSFCDYTFLQLGDFIEHICGNHMCQLTNPKLEDEFDYSSEVHEDINENDARIPTEATNMDIDDSKSKLREFEKVDIELEDKQMDDSMDFKDLNLIDEYVSEDSEDIIDKNEPDRNGNDDDDDDDSTDNTVIAVYRQRLGLREMFNKKMIVAIFKGYENRPALWDDDAQLNRDNKKRDMEIRSIAEELGIPNEWESIRKIIGKLNNRLRIELLRKNIYLSKGKIYTPAWYKDLITFLQLKRTAQVKCKSEIKTPTSKKRGIPDSILNDGQSILLAEIYKEYTGLWDETDITYLFTNRRREALKAVLEKFNKKSGLNLTEYGIECEIIRLRKICSQEKRQKTLCKQQNKNYKPSCNFYEHISYLEIDVLPFECSICEKVISGRSQYKIHVASHDGSLPYKCVACGHGFKLSTNLAVHLRRHVHDYLYKCEICGKPCATSTDIKIHMRSHTGEKPFVCEICGKSFSTSSMLCIHMRQHENRPTHKCEICNKAFYGKSFYREHMNVHQNVRDKICDICNKGFTSAKRLRAHKQIHAAEKRFACKICDKRFAQSAGLCGHMKSHGITQVTASSKDVQDAP